MGPSTTATVLDVAAELAFASGTRMVDPAALERGAAGQGVDRDACFAALVALRDARLIQLATSEPSSVVLVAMTDAGLLRHVQDRRPDLGAVEHRLAAAVTAAEGRGAVALADLVGEPALLVECLLDRWVNERRLVYSTAPRRTFRIHRVTGGLPGAAAATPEPAP